MHFCRTQLWWPGHSELEMHSGWQYGGEPLYSGRHEQEGISLMTWHWAYGPQGEGWQGFIAGATGPRVTNVFYFSRWPGRIYALYWFYVVFTHNIASDEWIACITFGTRAHRIMVDDYTSGLNAACTRARIFASLIDASFVWPTIGAESALWSAKGWWSKEFRRARAHGLSI